MQHKPFAIALTLALFAPTSEAQFRRFPVGGKGGATSVQGHLIARGMF